MGASTGKTMPTIIAISGGMGHTVSRFFRSWDTVGRGFQCLVPIRQGEREAFYNDEGVQELQHYLHAAQSVLGPIENGKFHLVGNSN